MGINPEKLQLLFRMLLLQKISCLEYFLSWTFRANGCQACTWTATRRHINPSLSRCVGSPHASLTQVCPGPALGSAEIQQHLCTRRG